MYNNCGSSSSAGNVYDQYDMNAQGMNQNRVKVEDALSYLDQVKTQFADQPNVYTQFLDIMKDFKSQAIDTPGVITRVSRLFQGRSALIMGFNTFLPPGFEVRVVGSRITIMEPSGNTQVIMNNPDVERVVEEKEISEGKAQVVRRISEQSSDEIQSIPPPVTLTPSPKVNAPILNQNRQDINEAIGYVNRIKARFANKPIVYKKFLDILHTYQRTVDKQARTPQREKAVLDAVTTLFGDEPDLLEEFRHFLPGVYGLHNSSDMLWECEQKGEVSSDSERPPTGEEQFDSEHEQLNTPRRRRRFKTGMSLSRTSSCPSASIWKREVEINDIVLNASVDDIMYFDKIRRCLDERKHDTFLRALNLYSANIITGSELLAMLENVFGKQAHLLDGLRRILGVEEICNNTSLSTTTMEQRFSSELAHQIDYSSCKQLGVSYRSLPDSFKRPLCSGRTPLCHEVLNDTWVSFPSWSSEDSTHVSSKKTQYEEFIYRTEDERFELDIIIDVNKYAIESLELVRRRMERMTQAELDNFQMRDKEKEWREAQVAMNRIWREQNEKHMMRSLDHQTNALRNSDSKWIKAKALLHHIEVMFDERQQKSEEGHCEDVGPHIVMLYPEDRSILHDASDLIIHYVKRQSNIHKEEKNKIKCILRRYVTEWFGVDDEEMSDGEENSDPLIDGIGPPKKRRKEDAPEDEPPKLISTAHYRLVYGGNSLFLFFRVHQMICDRLGKLKIKHAEQMKDFEDEVNIIAMQAQLYRIHGKQFGSHEQNASDTNNGLATIKNPRRSPVSNYTDLLSEIKNLLDGNIDSNTFEDNIRILFPIDGYLVTTIDKLIAMVGRQLHFMATGSEGLETMRLYQRYRYEKPVSVFSQSIRKIRYLSSIGVPSSFKFYCRIEEEYSQSAESFFNCQNCFKIFIIYENKPVVTIELVDTEVEEEITAVDNPNDNDDSAVYASSDDDSDQNEETVEERRRIARTVLLKPNGLSSVRSSRIRALHGNYHSSVRPPLQSKRSLLFLKRNARMRRSEIAKEFIAIGGTLTPSFSWEGIVRRNRFRGLASMERMHYIRKCRAGEMFAEEHGVTWLARGMQKITSHHPVYTFLQFNKYVVKSNSQPSRKRITAP
ncbi:histone deacetylase interacting [Dictyocaulus viviparus]|uniref:Histone deacetylase interacting n=1 Tax=Dictyocaulus viviparus TaxID=29172 RepID=A0A0D8XMZ7_DICVI|nr:histone deacetylase interacting [Dictyocaulus viviparus]